MFSWTIQGHYCGNCKYAGAEEATVALIKARRSWRPDPNLGLPEHKADLLTSSTAIWGGTNSGPDIHVLRIKFWIYIVIPAISTYLYHYTGCYLCILPLQSETPIPGSSGRLREISRIPSAVRCYSQIQKSPSLCCDTESRLLRTVMLTSFYDPRSTVGQAPQ